MSLFILGTYVTESTTVCDLGALVFFPVDKKKSVSYFDVPYHLEKAPGIVGHAIASFQFIGTLHEVPSFLGFYLFGADECVHHCQL